MKPNTGVTRTARTLGDACFVAGQHIRATTHRQTKSTSRWSSELAHGYISSPHRMLVIYAGLMESDGVLRTCTLLHDEGPV